jgi:NAD-dependent deacetylase
MPQAEQGKIVILTGAGISQESGLDTFRDSGGIWSQVEVEEVATPSAFARNPERVHDFYNQRRRQLFTDAVQPNAAHLALARLEADWPQEVLLVTQNIDDLHERAGSRNLIHMHGEIMKARCQRCGVVSPWSGDMAVGSDCPACHRSDSLRVNVVWFGEMPFSLDRIFEGLAGCRLFLSIGTSGTVHPAASFVQEARSNMKAHTVELNLERSDGFNLFHERHYGPATEVVPAFVDRILREGW